MTKETMNMTDEAMGAILLLEDRVLGGEHDFVSLSDAVDSWKRWSEAAQNGVWADGAHYGDCTKVPITCCRCLVDSYEKKFLEICKAWGYDES